MGERTSYAPGTFNWTDLTTPDLDAAKTFYEGLFGWQHEEMPMPQGGAYAIFRKDGQDAAGASAAQEGQHPAWLSYVSVDDLDSTASRAGELGASVMMEPFGVMDADRMAVLQDPTGAVFALWQPVVRIGASIVNGPGALTLNQLNTNEPERAREFYAALFGWRSEEVRGGDQLYWGLYNGERMNGGLMELPPDAGAPSHWLVFFGTDDIDAAAERIAESGGTVTVPKTPVPGGHFTVAHDPQRAVFALFEGNFDD